MRPAKVVFLDFDGVLNSWAYAAAGNGGNRGGLLGLDPAAVSLLNQILERTGADVVVSSSWRIIHKRIELCDRLVAAGFKGRVLGVTPHMGGLPRREEIFRWLYEHDFDGPFAILDDDGDASIEGRFVRTTFDLGLTTEHVEAVVAILGER